MRRQAGTALGLYVGIHAPDNSINFGGNLEVSPPISAATNPQISSRGGPAFPRHPPAPFGKIILGIPTRHVTPGGSTCAPVWIRHGLGVGHIDEFSIFVAAPTTSPPGSVGRKGWVALIAWPDRAMQLLRRIPGGATVTNLFRSRDDTHWPGGIRVSVADVIAMYAPLSGDPRKPLKNHDHQKALYSILSRLEKGLNLGWEDYILCPALFEPGLGETHALTPDMVNLLALGTNLIIPKPWGPRLSVADAKTVLVGLAGITNAMVTAAGLDALRGEWYWARAGETIANIATMFGACSFGLSEAKIKADNGIEGATVPAAPPWRRLWIWEDNVDLLEAFMAVKLKALGLTYHFVDDWDMYHAQLGEIHCGTNVNLKGFLNRYRRGRQPLRGSSKHDRRRPNEPASSARKIGGARLDGEPHRGHDHGLDCDATSLQPGREYHARQHARPSLRQANHRGLAIWQAGD